MNTRNPLVRMALASALTLAAVSGAAAQYDEAPAAPADPAPAPAPAPAPSDELSFSLDRSPGIVNAGCLPYAAGQVHIKSEGAVEIMDVSVSGLPANIELDTFVIQLPNAPFGLSWYQGDLETDEYGNGQVRYIGRFNEETFIVAPGVGPAPQIHGADAQENPATAPIHTFHLGIWFNSPDDARAAGCPDLVTPFNGEHNAGVQLFNTASFPDQAGPLSQLKP